MGVKTPDGFIPLFDIESSRCSDTPTVYGIVEDKEYIKDYMFQLEENTFWAVLRQELKERVNTKSNC